MTKKMEMTAFLVFLAVAVLVIGGHSFYRYYIVKGYPLHVFSACDPASHDCFVADPATADPTFQAGPYEKIEINAGVAPKCLDEHTCTDFSCTGIQGSCQVTFCSDSTKEDGESCSDASTASTTESQ